MRDLLQHSARVAPVSEGVGNNRSLMTILLLATALSCLAAAGGAQEPRRQAIVPLKPFATNQLIEVVSGNPDSAGVPFVLRIRNDDGMIVPVHWHPGDEHIVVLKGAWYLGTGDKFDRAALREMHVGDYGFVKRSDRVRAPKGEGVILDGFSARKDGLIEYRIQRADGTIFWAEQKDVHAARTRRRTGR
jgi:hypothetical protein